MKPIWILLKQETVSGNGISWAIYKSAPPSRQITMLPPRHSSVLQAGCPSCRPTNSIKALKVNKNLLTNRSKNKHNNQEQMMSFSIISNILCKQMATDLTLKQEQSTSLATVSIIKLMQRHNQLTSSHNTVQQLIACSLTWHYHHPPIDITNMHCAR